MPNASRVSVCPDLSVVHGDDATAKVSSYLKEKSAKSLNLGQCKSEEWCGETCPPREDGLVFSPDELLNNVTEIPPSAAASLRLLKLLNDEDASSGEIGRVIETDPSLTAHVLRLANTPYYGMSRRVASARQGLMVLGFDLVRSLVTNAAFGFHVGRRSGVPEGFWEHSLATGAAASVLASRTGFPASEAFSAGLLNDLGIALLQRYLGPQYVKIQARAVAESTSLTWVEREDLGLTHADIGARALDRMRFPSDIVTAIGEHHLLPNARTSVLGRIVFVADLLAHCTAGQPFEAAITMEQALHAAGFAEDDPATLVELTRVELDQFTGFLNASAPTRV